MNECVILKRVARITKAICKTNKDDDDLGIYKSLVS